jgi:predicted aminopeptidase
MPDVIWTVFADPANRGMLALMLVGVVFIVAGPWAIVRYVSRESARKGRARDAHGS